MGRQLLETVVILLATVSFFIVGWAVNEWEQPIIIAGVSYKSGQAMRRGV